MKGGFNLRKWRTSDKALQCVIDSKEISQPEHAKKVESDESSYVQAAVRDASQLKPNECKVVGIKWNSSAFNLILTFERSVLMGKEQPPTKRNLLKVAASLFDPIGFISPVAVQLEILLQ